MRSSPHPKYATRLVYGSSIWRHGSNHHLFPIEHIDLRFGRIKDEHWLDVLPSSPQNSIDGHGHTLIWHPNDALLGILNPNNHDSPLCIRHPTQSLCQINWSGGQLPSTQRSMSLHLLSTVSVLTR